MFRERKHERAIMNFLNKLLNVFVIALAAVGIGYCLNVEVMNLDALRSYEPQTIISLVLFSLLGLWLVREITKG